MPLPIRLSVVGLAAVLAAALTLPALAVDTGGGGGTPAAPAMAPAAPMAAPHHASPAAKAKLLDLNDARKLIAKSDWAGAIKMLRVIVRQQPKNADALNLLGYSLRQSGDMKEAEAWYLKALKLKPNHLGANEYLGELYLEMNDLPKAQERLQVLKNACGDCEEYEDLDEAVADYKKAHGQS
jgi:tetratricopeptide (TPR) repeat protein